MDEEILASLKFVNTEITHGGRLFISFDSLEKELRNMKHIKDSETVVEVSMTEEGLVFKYG